MDAPLRIPLGSSNAYLLAGGSGYLLIDAGNRGREGLLFDALRRHGSAPRDIRLILITHVHFDHVGGLKLIQARTAAPVMVHETESGLLEHGIVVIPAGTMWFTRPTAFLGQRLGSHIPALRFDPCTVDYRISGDTALADFGFDARVIPTPGHSAGSISVLTAGGDAFVGDLCHNGFRSGGPIFPPFADDVPALLRSWRALLEHPVHTIYPGHGTPFDAALLRARLDSMTAGA